MNVQSFGGGAAADMEASGPHLVAHWAEVIGILALGIVNSIEFPQHAQEIGLAF